MLREEINREREEEGGREGRREGGGREIEREIYLCSSLVTFSCQLKALCPNGVVLQLVKPLCATGCSHHVDHLVISIVSQFHPVTVDSIQKLFPLVLTTDYIQSCVRRLYLKDGFKCDFRDHKSNRIT